MTDDEDLRSLVEQGAALTNRYLRAGPGSAGARPHLDEAITVLDRAYARFEPGQALRGQVAGQLGWLYGVRHLAHGGSAHDRTTGMHLLDESLRFAQLPPVQQGSTRIVLGQLLLAGATAGLRSPDALMRTMTGGGSGDLADVDRAVALFREVADGPPVSAEMISTARTLLTVAEALRGMLGGPGGMDLGRMSAAFAAVQGFQPGGHMGAGMAPPPIPDPSASATPSPFAERAEPDIPYEESPVAIVDGPLPEAGPPARARPRPWPTPPAAELRDLPATTVDEKVALAAAVAEAEGAQPADHLTLAAALADRHDADGGSGWGDGRDDLRAAAESLNRVAAVLPGASSNDVVAAVRLAERLDGALPGAARLSDGFTEVAAVLRAAGIDAFEYPGLIELDTARGRLGRAPAGTRRAGRIVATAPDAGSFAADATISYVRTAADLVALIGRGRRPVTEAPVFVANPRHDRDHATMDALLLRRTFYPRSTGLGHTVEFVDGPGRPDEVRAHLDASLLHLGCGITPAGALELAGPAELAPADIAAGPRSAGGVAVLPPSPHGVAPLVDALLARGYSAVIGFSAAVPDEVASAVYRLLHAALADDSLDPAAAVAAVKARLPGLEALCCHGF